MGSDMSMEIRSHIPRKPRLEWENDELVIYRDYPISGWTEVWRGVVDVDNPTEVELIQIVSGQKIPAKPTPAQSKRDQVEKILRFNYARGNDVIKNEVINQIMEVFE